ncbi:hypothetical protein ACQKPX_09195 [Photobacterium sp. DNB23_23_1]
MTPEQAEPGISKLLTGMVYRLFILAVETGGIGVSTLGEVSKPYTHSLTPQREGK